MPLSPQFETNNHLLAATDGLIAKLRRHGLKLGSAESCTGGLFGALITEHAGVSDIYLGGIIAYDNRIKTEILGVPDKIIETYGAVSPEVAHHMAQGARTRLNSDLAISVTGIAGPGGGTIQKPVGMVCFGLSGCIHNKTIDQDFIHYFGDLGRQAIRLKSVETMIEMANQLLNDLL